MGWRLGWAVLAVVGVLASATPANPEIFLIVEDSVAVFPDNAGGVYPPSRSIFRSGDPMVSARSVALDASRGELYVLDYIEGVNVFQMTASGTVAALRTLVGAATGFVTPGGIVVDTVHDELYVTDSDAFSVFVFPRTADGDQAPPRTIAGSNAFGASGRPALASLDLLHDELYVSVIESGNSRVAVFDRTASGDSTPKRTLTGLHNPRSVVVDLGRDELFVTEYDDRQIKVFARTAAGPASPLRTIVLPPGAGQPWELVITNDDELLVALNVNHGPRVIGYPVTADGPAAPTRSLEPAVVDVLGFSSGVVSTRAKECSADRVVDDCLLLDGFESDSLCTVGWSAISGSSSSCQVCGDGMIEGTETCDDDDLFSGDGCSPLCVVDHGWTCAGEPSVCATTCGDGKIAFGVEACDDGDAFDGDGCSSSCSVEVDYSCELEPSICTLNND